MARGIKPSVRDTITSSLEIDIVPGDLLDIGIVLNAEFRFAIVDVVGGTTITIHKASLFDRVKAWATRVWRKVGGQRWHAR